MIPFDIPDDWSPEQALAVYELLNALTEHLWDRYQMQLIELLAPEINPENTSQLALFELDDEIPF